MNVTTLQHALIVALVVLTVIGVVRFEVFCLEDLASTPDQELRVLPRQAWLGFVLLCIPLGGVFYLLYGRPR